MMEKQEARARKMDIIFCFPIPYPFPLFSGWSVDGREKKGEEQNKRQNPRLVQDISGKQNNLPPFILPQSQTLPQLLLLLGLSQPLTTSLAMISFQRFVHATSLFALGPLLDKGHEEINPSAIEYELISALLSHHGVVIIAAGHPFVVMTRRFRPVLDGLYLSWCSLASFVLKTMLMPMTSMMFMQPMLRLVMMSVRCRSSSCGDQRRDGVPGRMPLGPLQRAAGRYPSDGSLLTTRVTWRRWIVRSGPCQQSL